jgi:NADH-quinone oxidoreductase subunit E
MAPQAETQVMDPGRRAMLLTALYIAQEQQGHLTREAIERVAARLGLPASEVYSMASFYTLYRTEPGGRYVLQVCEGLSCHLVGGAERLVDCLRKKLAIEVGQTTPDGLFTLETVQCLATCGTSPAMRVNDALYEDMTAEKIDELLETLRGYHV